MSREETTIWHRQPAQKFEEAYPIGNGRLGAMIFGRPWNREDYFSERIPLNEESLWYGGPTRRENPDARKTLPEVRRLLLEGEIARAEDLADTGMTATPRNGSPYQALGELVLTAPQSHRPVSGYRRSLDLATGLTEVAYTAGASRFQVTSWASVPDDVLVFHIRGPRAGLNFHAYLRRRPFDGTAFRTRDQIVGFTGQAGPGGVAFAAAATIVTAGGSVRIEGQSLRVCGADSATIIVAAWTTFRKPNPRLACLKSLRAARRERWPDLQRRHVRHHNALFRRVSLELGPRSRKPTDERLAAARQGRPDPSLHALLYHFGRYLLIATSRPDTLPMTLQGIWCDAMTPIWNCNYTINVNLQMSYWPAEPAALPECHLALLEFLRRLVARGQVTARKMYGCRGFVAHHTSDLWADTAPTGGVYASALWPFGGAWLALHAWEHFLFTGDRDFLRRSGYPILREGALFFSDYLVRNAKNELVAVPSVSPENFFRLPGGGKGKLCGGAAMDAQILRELFSAAIAAAEALGVDAGRSALWKRQRMALPPPRIRRDGTIQEWEQFAEDVEAGHRHLSHLFAVFPGSQITPEEEPRLAEAARKTLRRKLAHRTDRTGWSQAWMVNLFARLGDAESAAGCLDRIVREFTHPSLLGDCPPLNLDSNFGACSGISEMLLQSHRGIIRLLPALPKCWSQGSVRGLMARGGIRVAMAWKSGALREVRLSARNATKVIIDSPVALLGPDA
nr:glycoside hydrolase family 95 protein [Terrimicrobiaceae bacterium]